MSRIILRLAVLIISLSLLSACPKNEQKQLKKVLARVSSQKKLLQSLKADIERVQTNSQLGEKDKFEGELVMLPGEGRKLYFRLDWKTMNGVRNAETLSIGNGKYVIFRPNIKRAYHGDTDSKIFDVLSLSEQSLKENFDFRYIAEEKLEDGSKASRLRITAKKMKNVKSIDVWIDPTGMPRRIFLESDNGDTDLFSLNRIRKNELVNGNIFVVKMPKGTQMIKN